MQRALLALMLGLSSFAAAQTAAELVTATSIVGTLGSMSGVRLPTGTSFVTNTKYAAQLAPKLLGAEASKFADFKLYVTRGLAMRLADSYVNDLRTGFAVAGFFQGGSRPVTVAGATWTRTDFQDEGGKTSVLFVLKSKDDVRFLTASPK